jgi:hypothetical protein
VKHINRIIVKLKKVISLILIIFALQNCVCSYSYKAENQGKGSYFKKDSVNFAFNLSNDKKNLYLILYFDDNFKSEMIDDISITITQPDKTPIKLKTVSMYWSKRSTSYLNDARYIQSKFRDLPENERMTTVPNDGIYYNFTYNSDQKIISKTLNLNYKISLKSGSIIEGIENLTASKYYHFAVH